MANSLKNIHIKTWSLNALGFNHKDYNMDCHDLLFQSKASRCKFMKRIYGANRSLHLLFKGK